MFNVFGSGRFLSIAYNGGNHCAPVKIFFMAENFSVLAKNGMVASSQPLATLAGVQMLMSGGNAIDAAIATAAVLGVVEPSSIGIGSDAFCLFYSAKDKTLKALDASGRSPYAASQDF
jgi:gamma-glutamyltranspeptidase/glutathione hydrolase